MGKADSTKNLPCNDSLSMTLRELCTVVEVEAQATFSWIPEAPSAKVKYKLTVPDLSQKGVERILSHVHRVIESAPKWISKYDLEYSAPRGLSLKTANTFPSSAGVASSASSFAAVTLATLRLGVSDEEKFQRVWSESLEFRVQAAELSRQGSGSSCRSMDGPWVKWESEKVRVVNSNLPELCHMVLLVSGAPKEVGSSEAHHRVKSSPLWLGRVERANNRGVKLEQFLQDGNLVAISRLVWEEFIEMHSLFHTSQPDFTYWEPKTLEILNWIRPLVIRGTAPIVTMDAGANIHLILPKNEKEKWSELLATTFPDVSLLFDKPGKGAEIFNAMD